MKALVGAFNQEKALVGAFSVIVQPVVEPMDRFAALITTLGSHSTYTCFSVMDLVEGHTNKDFRMSVAPTTCAVWTGETTTGGEACVFPFLYEADGYDNNNHKFYLFIYFYSFIYS